MKKIGNILFLYFFVFIMCMGASFAWYAWKGSEVNVNVNFADLDPYIKYTPLTIKDSDKNKTLTESNDYTGGIGYNLVFNKNANGDNLDAYGQNYLKVTSVTNSDIFKASNLKWTLVSVSDNTREEISTGNFVGENVVEGNDISKMIPISIDFSLTKESQNTNYEFYLWLDSNSHQNVDIRNEDISVSMASSASTIKNMDEKMYIRSIEYGNGVINKFVAYSSKYDISGYKIINTETTPDFGDSDWIVLNSSNSVVEDATIESGKIVTIKPNYDMKEINNICIKITNGKDNKDDKVYCKSIGKYSDEVDRPTNKLCNNLTYNGGFQQLVSSTSGTGYTLSGYNQKNAGTYTITATLKDNYSWKTKVNGSNTDKATFDCNIKQKTLTVKALDQTITYGESISLSAYTYDGLVEGDMLASVNLIPSTSEVTDNGTITPKVGIIMNDDGEDLVDNYNIIYVKGKLVIKDKVYQLYDSSGTSTGYADSLSNAISKVKSGGTIKALKNNSSDAVTIDKNVTLDTNGKTITLNGTITNKATTTIIGSGTIYYSTTSTTAKVITNSSGILTITDSILKSDSRFVITSSSGTVNINGGTYVVNASDCSSGCAPFMPTGGTVNINGGTYQGNKLNYLVINSGGTVNFGETKELTVSGLSMWNNSGTINFKQGTLKDVSNGITAKGGNVNISGGTIGVTSRAIRNDGGNVTISGGEFYTSSTASIKNLNGTSDINGGIYHVNSTDCSSGCAPFEVAGGIVNINSGTYQGDKLNYLAINSGGTVNFGETKAITISGLSMWNNSGTINFKQGTLNGVTGGIVVKDGTLNVSGGSIVASDTAMSSTSGTINITGGTISGGATGIAIGEDGTNPTLNITGGSITGTGYAGVYIGSGTVNIGTKDGNVSTTSPNIYSKSYSLRNGGGTWNWYDGALYGANNPTFDKAPSGTESGYYAITASDSTYGYKTYLSKSYTVTFYKNQDYLEAKNSLIATISGRRFYKTNAGAALVAYVDDGTYTGPLLVSETATAVEYYSPDHTACKDGFTSAGSFTYDGKTYYYSAGSCWMAGSQNDTSGLGRTKYTVTRTNYSEDSAKAAAQQLVADSTSTSTTQSVEVGVSTALKANTYTKTNYTFKGWATSPTGDVVYSDKQNVTNVSTKLYAVWVPKTFALTLTKGTGVEKINYKINGADSYTSVTTSTTTVNVNYGTRYMYFGTASTGYTMSSCTSTSACSGIMTATKSVTLSAKLNTYTMTITKNTGIKTIYYKVNGASSWTSTTSSTSVSGVKYGTVVTYYYTVSTGYTASKTCTSSSPCTLSSSVTGNLTLSPTATLNSYTIVFNSNGGTGTMSNLAMTYGTAKTLTANSFKKQYTVTYNYSGATGGNSQSSATANYKFVGWTMGGPNLYSKLNLENNSFSIDDSGMYYLNRNNTSTSTQYVNFFFNTRDDIISGKDYTEISVIKSLTYSGDMNYYVGDSPNASGTITQVSDGVKSVSDLIVGNNYFSLTGTSITNPSLLSRGFIGIPAGASLNIKFRPILIASKYNNIDMYYYNSSSVKNLTSTKGGKVNLYADWNEMPITLPTPTKTGYTFAGWYTSSSGGTKVGNGGDSYIPTSNITLYARWNPQKLTIIYNKNDGSGATSSETFTWDGNMGDDYFAPSSSLKTRTGYTFGGWSKKSDCSDSIAYSFTATVGTDWFLSEVGTSSSVTLNLYARWNPKKLTVTFDKNDGSGETASQSFTYGASGNRFGYNTDGNLKWGNSGQFGGWDRTGYTLLGWSKSSNASSATYSTYSGVSDVWIDSNSPSVTLYAIWQVKTYTLTIRGYDSVGTGYYKINGASSYTSFSAFANTITLSVKYGSTYYYYATPADDTVYMAKCSQSSPCSGTMGASDVTVSLVGTEKAANTLTVTARTLTENGSAQQLVSVSKAQGTVYYAVGTQLTSSNYSSAGSTTIPTRTSAGTYKVYYYTPGNTYYLSKSGSVNVTIASIPNGWVGDKYYVNGTAVKGWKQINNNWYYFNSSGNKVTSKWIYATESDTTGGACASSCSYDSSKYWYYVNSSGIMVKGNEGANSSGSSISARANSMASLIDGNYYSFTTDGRLFYGYTYLSGGIYVYYTNASVDNNNTSYGNISGWRGSQTYTAQYESYAIGQSDHALIAAGHKPITGNANTSSSTSKIQVYDTNSFTDSAYNHLWYLNQGRTWISENGKNIRCKYSQNNSYTYNSNDKNYVCP